MRKLWTPEEIKTLTSLYPDTPMDVIMETLGRTVGSIRSQVHLSGLKRSPEFLAKHVFVMDPKTGEKTRFKKGNISHNKGLAMPAHVREKAAATMFKKGNKPHNTKPVGTQVWRFDKCGKKYLFQKVSDSNWQLVHRMLWESVNGPIPKGFRVYFKDENTENITIENLELALYAKGMIDNSIHQLPAELKEVISIKKRINIKIKNHGKKQN